MKIRFWLVGWFCLAASPGWAREFSDYSSAEQILLQDGFVVVGEKAIDPSSEKRFVAAAILLEEPLDEVWALVDQKEEIHKVMESVISATVLSREKNVTRISQKVTGIIRGMTATYTVEHTGHYPDRVDFKRISGDFRDVLGCWIFEAVESAGGSKKTLLSYELHLDAGRFIPQNLMVKTQKEKIPKILIAIREQLKVPPVLPE